MAVDALVRQWQGSKGVDFKHREMLLFLRQINANSKQFGRSGQTSNALIVISITQNGPCDFIFARLHFPLGRPSDIQLLDIGELMI